MPAPKERHTDHPCPFLEELIVGDFVCLFWGLWGFFVVIVLGCFFFWQGIYASEDSQIFNHCFWDCPCWSCSVSLPVILHWSDPFCRNICICFWKIFVLLFIKLIHICMYLLAPPMSATENTVLHFPVLYIIISYLFWAWKPGSVSNSWSCFTSSVMLMELPLIMHGFFCVALKMKQEYKRQWQTTFCLPKSKLLPLF